MHENHLMVLSPDTKRAYEMYLQMCRHFNTNFPSGLYYYELFKKQCEKNYYIIYDANRQHLFWSRDCRVEDYKPFYGSFNNVTLGEI